MRSMGIILAERSCPRNVSTVADRAKLCPCPGCLLVPNERDREGQREGPGFECLGINQARDGDSMA